MEQIPTNKSATGSCAKINKKYRNEYKMKIVISLARKHKRNWTWEKV